MSLESGTYISDLVTTNPTSGDPRGQGDDHLRLLKSVLQNTLPVTGRAWRFPRFSSKITSFNPASTDDETIFLIDTSGGDVTVTLPTLTAGTTAWLTRYMKTTSDANKVIFSGTVNGTSLPNLTKQNEGYHIGWNGAAFYELLSPEVGTSQIADKAVTYGKIQDAVAAMRILAAGSIGPYSEKTLSEILDFIGSAAQGDLLYRGASVWGRLAAGTLGQQLLSGGASANPSWGSAGGQLLHVNEETANNTNSTTNLVSGSWVKLVLNNIKTNEIANASVSSSQISLPAGTYEVFARAPSCQSGGTGNTQKLRLRNTTDGSTIMVSATHAWSGGGSAGGSVPIEMNGRFTLAGTKLLEFQYYQNTGTSGTGVLGGNKTTGYGEVEVYAEIMIRRVA